MGLKKRISALLICSSIVLGSITPAYADGANEIGRASCRERV